ncbi:MAG: response regulator transcription factor [Lachnospiraceae bacterium]|nr:response regulator transcription factor [Lachnospiraceae bacterium]
MNIAFCDDQNIVTNQLNKLIQEFDKEILTESTLLSFSTPSDLYTHMQTNSIDVVFMDLAFPDTSEDGIEWSKKIKKQFPRTIIIILTAYESRYKEGFVARAFRFMTKPIQKAELFDNLYACMEELQLTQTVSLPKYGTLHPVMVKDIFYLSALSGGSELWTRSHTFVSEKSLLQWEEQLPKTTFFRCHKKYLINLLHVKSFENHVLTLITGEKIPISRRRWKEFQIAYIRCDIQNNSIT